MYTSYREQRRMIFNPRIPRYQTTLAITCDEPTNVVSHNFAGNYRAKLDTSWAPRRTGRPDPPHMIQASQIYHKAVGQIPGYGGHVPGDINRYGCTYGKDTVDCARYIRGDY